MFIKTPISYIIFLFILKLKKFLSTDLKSVQQQPLLAEERIVEVYENQEWAWHRGWMPCNGLGEAPHWSYEDGTKAQSVMEIALPDDWQWSSEWETSSKWEYRSRARMHRRRVWKRRMVPTSLLTKLMDLPLERTHPHPLRESLPASNVSGASEVFLSSVVGAEPSSVLKHSYHTRLARMVGWNFKGIAFGFKKPLFARGVVLGVGLPISRHFDSWHRSEFLPSVSSFFGGSILPPILTATVSCSFPLEFFTSAVIFNWALLRDRKNTVRRLGVTYSVVYTPASGVRHYITPWFFILPGARAVFQFLRILLLWAVTVYDKILFSRPNTAENAHPSLKQRFPTLWKLRRWTGSKTSGFGFSFAYRPTMNSFSCSALINFEPFFLRAIRKKRQQDAKTFEQKEIKHHKQQVNKNKAWYDQLEGKSYVKAMKKQSTLNESELQGDHISVSGIAPIPTAISGKYWEYWYKPRDQDSFVSDAAQQSSNFVNEAANQISTFVNSPKNN